MGGIQRFDVRRFDTANATEADMAAAVAAARAMGEEFSPEDAPIPDQDVLDDLVRNLSWQRIHRFHALDDDGAIVGTGLFECEVTETNQHLGFFNLWVRPDRRREGLGRQLLAHVVEAARAEGRTRLFAHTVEGTAGESFLEAAGGEKRSVERKSRLTVANVDRDMLEEWCRRAKERASDYSLVAWDGPTPDDLLPAYAALREVMNTAPRDGLEFDDEV